MKEKPKCPIDPVRMAWPFKTEEERKALQKWYKQTQEAEKQRRLDRILDAERAFL